MILYRNKEKFCFDMHPKGQMPLEVHIFFEKNAKAIARIWHIIPVAFGLKGEKRYAFCHIFCFTR